MVNQRQTVCPEYKLLSVLQNLWLHDKYNSRRVDVSVRNRPTDP